VIKQYHQDAPKEKLPIEIADIDRIHVYDVYVLETRECQVGEYFTPKPTRADDEDLALVSQEVLDLQATGRV
jgi:hypothetical protein